jgi:hypothetical protein
VEYAFPVTYFTGINAVDFILFSAAPAGYGDPCAVQNNSFAYGNCGPLPISPMTFSIAYTGVGGSYLAYKGQVNTRTVTKLDDFSCYRVELSIIKGTLTIDDHVAPNLKAQYSQMFCNYENGRDQWYAAGDLTVEVPLKN